jgi:hypothetical protein
LFQYAGAQPITNGEIVNINLAVGPVMALIAGVLILIVPRLLNYIVAIYLIIVGLIGIFGWNGAHLHSTSMESGPAQIAPVLTAVAAPMSPGVDSRIGRLRSERWE